MDIDMYFGSVDVFHEPTESYSEPDRDLIEDISGEPRNFQFVDADPPDPAILDVNFMQKFIEEESSSATRQSAKGQAEMAWKIEEGEA